MKSILFVLCVIGNSAVSLYITNDTAPANFRLYEMVEKQELLTGAMHHFDLSRRGGRGKARTDYDCTPGSLPHNIRTEMNLDRFYTKYAHAYGVPIISSHRVSNAAIRRACYVVRFALADRQDIRDWLHDRYGRAGIIGVQENTNSIPEHRHLPNWWNKRARGLGATLHAPISTGGEENIMCMPHDRYYGGGHGEDIFLHEFAHAIHNLGVTGAIPTFDSEIRSLYNRRKRDGRWRNTYYMSTDREFFAEGVTSYFDVNTETYNGRPNGIHNHVNTRAELKSYDRELFNLVQKVFPCGNTFLDRCSAKRGVKPKPFRMNCQDDGGTIVTNRPPTGNPNTRPTQKPKPTLTVCRDQNRSCNRWARGGECDKNPGYMLKYCCQSCKKKPASCVDKYPAYCSKYGRTYCRSSSYSRNCRRTCGCTR